MARVRHQGMAAQVIAEDLLTGGDGVVLAHFVEAPGAEGLGRAFDDEGRGARLELVGMRPDPAVTGLLEDEGEGIGEGPGRAEPGEMAATAVDLGTEHLLELGAGAGVQTVGGDHEIMAGGIAGHRPHLGLEPQLDAQLARPLLQDQQQPLAPDAAETMAGRDGARTVLHHRHIVPIGKVITDRCGRDWIVGREIAQRLVRQHDAPAEGVVGAVALDHHDLVRGIAQLGRYGEIEPRRPSTDARDPHGPSPNCQREARTHPDSLQA